MSSRTKQRKEQLYKLSKALIKVIYLAIYGKIKQNFFIRSHCK